MQIYAGIYTKYMQIDKNTANGILHILFSRLITEKNVWIKKEDAPSSFLLLGSFVLVSCFFENVIPWLHTSKRIVA